MSIHPNVQAHDQSTNGWFFRPICWTSQAGTGSETTRQFASTRSSLASSPSPASPPDSSPWPATWWPPACLESLRRCRAGRKITFQPPTKLSSQRLSLQLLSGSLFRCKKKQQLLLNSPVQEVAEICYLRLNLLLVAVEARKYEGGAININPNGKKITPNAIGLFISDSSDKVKRAWFYCRLDVEGRKIILIVTQGLPREHKEPEWCEEMLVQETGQGPLRIFHLWQGFLSTHTSFCKCCTTLFHDIPSKRSIFIWEFIVDKKGGWSTGTPWSRCSWKWVRHKIFPNLNLPNISKFKYPFSPVCSILRHRKTATCHFEGGGKAAGKRRGEEVTGRDLRLQRLARGTLIRCNELIFRWVLTGPAVSTGVWGEVRRSALLQGSSPRINSHMAKGCPSAM